MVSNAGKRLDKLERLLASLVEPPPPIVRRIILDGPISDADELQETERQRMVEAGK